MGRDIGESYALHCIASWHAAGFSPISVNSAAELANRPINAKGVQILSVKRDAMARTGRPLVFLEDMLAAALSLESDWIAITNADILLDPQFDLAATVFRLRPGEALVSKRTEIERPEDRSGPTYELGFDFFAVHRQDLARIRDFGLIFGEPWWDYILPLILLLQGVDLARSAEPFVFHLRHEERWKREIWCDMGWSCAEQLGHILEHEAARLSADRARMFRRRLSAALFGGPADVRFLALRVLAGVFRSLTPTHRTWALMRFASATVDLIDANHHPLPSRQSGQSA
jgi:hypothetical protein